MSRPQYPCAAVNPRGYLSKIASIIWLDLETTGLDPREGYLLEVAVQGADASDPLRLGEMACTPVRIAPATAHAACDDYVRRMHTENGLFSDCQASLLSLGEVDEALAKAFRLSEGERVSGQRHMLAGNSVGSFDLQWVREHLPQFARTLSHRVFDVSTLIAFAEMLGWQYERQQPAHRADDDVRMSQETLRSILGFITQ